MVNIKYMFSNIYSCLSNAYNYVDSSIRNNPFIFNLIPVWFQMIAPALYSNAPQLESVKPIFSYIYSEITKNNKNNNLNNKNNSIINWVEPENMGCTNTKKEVNNNTVEIKKKKAIPKKIRDAVWLKYHGDKDEGVCYSCGEKVKRYNAGWQCSHVHSESTGGEISVENLRTGCIGCNLSCGDKNLYAFIRDKDLHGPGRKNVNAYFKKNPSQINSKRTNNWGNNKKKSQENKNIVNKKGDKGWLAEWI